MTAVPVLNAGDYDLLVDVGFLVDGFVLDDPVRGVLGGYATTTTRTNLIPNPSFETNTTGWLTVAGATLTRTSIQSVFGSNSVSNTRASTTGNLAVFSSPRIAVTPGQDYTFSLYFRRDYSTTRSTFLRSIFFDSGGTNIGSTQIAISPPAQNTWGRFSHGFTPPVNTAVVQVDVFVSNALVGETIFVDGILLETGSTVLPYFDGTVADPYSGYTLTAQAWNGTTNNSTSTATWGLDSAFYAGNPLDGTTSFASVIDGTKSIRVKRGRQDQTDAFATGTMSFVLDDTRAGGVFNPFDDDPSNPYYDQAAGTPGLAPGREVRLVRVDDSNVEELLFVGTVVDYDLTFSVGALTEVTVLAADGNYRLANTFIGAHTPSVELSGARIEAILDRAEVDYPGGAARNISSGTVNLGDYPIGEGTNVKAYFDAITSTAERGRIFLSRDGVLTATNRLGVTISNPVVVFSDDGTETPYNDLEIVFDADELVNRVTVTPVGGTTETASDSASIAKYFTKALDISGSLLDQQTDAADLADYLLKPEPSPRFTALEVFFGSLTTAQKDAVAVVDIGDTIEITRTIQTGNSTTTITQESQVEGVEHHLSAGRGHTVRFYTSPTTIAVLLVLDTGILDQDALG